MYVENPVDFLLHICLFLFINAFFAYIKEELPVSFDLNEGFLFEKIKETNEIIIEGSQSSYLTKVNKNLKIVNDYQQDFILMCCYILRTRTDEDIQDLLKQILCVMKSRNIAMKSVKLDEELYCDIRLEYSSSQMRGKGDMLNTNIQLCVSSDILSNEEILHRIQLIREHYMGIIGNARPECVAEMYTHLYNEPCLVDEEQLNRINKTPKEILDCYHRHRENPESFIRGLLRNK